MRRQMPRTEVLIVSTYSGEEKWRIIATIESRRLRGLNLVAGFSRAAGNDKRERERERGSSARSVSDENHYGDRAKSFPRLFSHLLGFFFTSRQLTSIDDEARRKTFRYVLLGSLLSVMPREHRYHDDDDNNDDDDKAHYAMHLAHTRAYIDIRMYINARISIRLSTSICRYIEIHLSRLFCLSRLKWDKSVRRNVNVVAKSFDGDSRNRGVFARGTRRQ